MTDYIGDYREYVRRNPFMEYNHIEIVSASTERSVVKLELRRESMNRYGMVHGGMIYSMADGVAGITARADGHRHVTQSSHMNFLRNVESGTIYAEGVTIRRGRHMVIIHVKVYTEDEVLLADGSMDMMRTD